ncbi:beta-ketoacyl synthase N-terminal-like domain-containing protein [Bowmanella denitrificans]|uniref:polyketide synthase family protein n=1 Tax=Bowmanella denitrificans TaxID=366582 RepID=UPI000C9B181C|nr:beta-ketoacyl synthase N-terminal-like domain-containing protein [Bowmanella denitrificans]
MRPIAIVGMGCLFPGAASPQEYWQNLLAEQDATSFLSDDLLGVPLQHYVADEPGTPDKINYHKNGHIRGFRFDAQGYRLPADKLEGLDNLFKWTLYAANQAWRDAQQPDSASGRCGLVLGNIGMPTHAGKRYLNGFYNKVLEPYIRDLLGDERFRFAQYWPDGQKDADNLSTTSYNATIAAMAMGLQGPVYTLDAACSSALYAIQMACFYLSSHKADVMLSGAVCHADHIYIDHGFNMLHAFPSPGQQSIPFDRHSEGLKAGEGAGVVALKRLEDAERDGDRIYGVIESIGLSNDAGAKHILVPDTQGQKLALSRAYANGNSLVDYLECHATGTPVGDQVELNSIEQFFGQDHPLPLIGANKGNVGHMLTASGMASLIKVLLSMRHGQIPATIDLKEMVSTKGGNLNIDRVVRKAQAWPTPAGQRRAGINAFGFGGVNGHMVLRDAVKCESAQDKQRLQLEKMVITGMSVAMAETHSVNQFNTSIRDAKQHFSPLPGNRWSGLEQRKDLLDEYGLTTPPLGAYIEKFEFDCKRFKMPPNMAGIHLLSHLSLMQLAAGAFVDAGYQVDSKVRNIAVIVAADSDYLCYRYQARNEAAWQVRDSLAKSGVELSAEQVATLEGIVKDSLFPEPYAEGITGGIGNVVASRISASLRLSGPAFTVCAQENSVFRALELARFLLSLDGLEAVIVGSGSFCGGPENVLLSNPQQPANQGRMTLSFDHQATGWNVGEGGAVVVLKSETGAAQSQDKQYASIESLAFATAEVQQQALAYPSAEGIDRCARQALSEAGIEAADVGYLEAHASGIAAEDQAELAAICRVYTTPQSSKTTVLGSAKANFGHLGCAAGMVSLVKSALCLSQGYLPATPNWQGAESAEQLDNSGLKVIGQSQDWADALQGQGYAAISSMGRDLTYAHVVLKAPQPEARRSQLNELDSESLRSGSLLKEIHVGREKAIGEMILCDASRQRLGLEHKGEAGSVAVREVADTALAEAGSVASLLQYMRGREAARNLSTHLAYLRTEQRFYHQLTSLAQGKMLASGGSRSARPVPSVTRPAADLSLVNRKVLFNRADLEEMTDGRVAKVLGEQYAEADQYPIRTRMPSPPYLFVSRILTLTAEFGKLEPCVIEWEYDLEPTDWFVYHNLVPAFVSLESSHAMIVAFTCIGCDQLFKGELKYRAIDSQTTIYSDLPKAGEVLRGKVQIHGFTKVGKNVLIRYEYDGYVGDRHSFKLTATSGFFPVKEIDQAKAFDTSKLFAKATPQPSFAPLLPCAKTQFSDQDLQAVQAGDLAGCFGAHFGSTPAPGLYAAKAQMLDRVLSLDPNGGPWGLGQALGERDIDPSHWAFAAHFKNDPVLPGTLIVEGAEQLVRFYLYYLGLHSLDYLKPQLICEHTYSAKFRGEVKCATDKLQYRLSVKHLECKSAADGRIASLEILFIAETLYRNKVIGVCDNLGARFVADAS